MTNDQAPQQIVVQEEQEGNFPQDGAVSCSANGSFHFSFDETEAQRCDASKMQGSAMGLILTIMADKNTSLLPLVHPEATVGHLVPDKIWVGGSPERARELVRAHS